MNFPRVKPTERGFTLVELLIVMAIVAVLASVSLTYYNKYKDKSLVTSHALPIANACAKDIIAYCINLSPSATESIDVSTLDLKNCKNQEILSYNLKIAMSGSFKCNPGGSVSEGVIEATLEDVSTYKAVCYLEDNALRCKVEDQ